MGKFQEHQAIDMNKESFSLTPYYPLLLLLLGLALYGGKLQVPFMWDDYPFILQNESIHTLSNIPQFFVSDTSLLYRPLRQVLYALSYAMFGESPLGYHLVGLLLFTGCLLCTYRLLVLLSASKEPALSFCCALLFALHPVHADRVMMITASYDILGDFFTLASFISFLSVRLESKQRRGGYLLSLMLFLFALLSSETGAVLPFLLLGYELCFKKEGRSFKKNLLFLRPFFLLLLAYLLLRAVVLHGFSRDGGAEQGNYLLTLFQMPEVFLGYLQLLVAPLHLFTYRGADALTLESMSSLPIPLSAFLFCFLLIGWGIWGKGDPLFRFSILWFFISLLPVSNIIPIGTIMEDRYLFIPSIALSLFSLALCERFRQKQTIFLLGLVLFTLFLGFLSAEKNKSYRSEQEKWLYDFHEMVQSLPASRWEAVKRKAEGFQINQANLTAPAVNKDRSILCYQAGNSLRESEPEKAETLYKIALVLNPRNYPAWHNLFVVILEKGAIGTVQEGLVRLAAERNLPIVIKVELLMMRMEWCIQKKHHCWKAPFQQLKKMQMTNEQRYSLFRNAGIGYLQEGEKPQAKTSFKKALQLSKKEANVLKKKIEELNKRE